MMTAIAANQALALGYKYGMRANLAEDVSFLVQSFPFPSLHFVGMGRVLVVLLELVAEIVNFLAQARRAGFRRGAVTWICRSSSALLAGWLAVWDVVWAAAGSAALKAQRARTPVHDTEPSNPRPSARSTLRSHTPTALNMTSPRYAARRFHLGGLLIRSPRTAGAKLGLAV